MEYPFVEVEVDISLEDKPWQQGGIEDDDWLPEDPAPAEAGEDAIKLTKDDVKILQREAKQVAQDNVGSPSVFTIISTVKESGKFYMLARSNGLNENVNVGYRKRKRKNNRSLKVHQLQENHLKNGMLNSKQRRMLLDDP